jgi:hypothetical protein
MLSFCWVFPRVRISRGVAVPYVRDTDDATPGSRLMRFFPTAVVYPLELVYL